MYSRTKNSECSQKISYNSDHYTENLAPNREFSSFEVGQFNCVIEIYPDQSLLTWHDDDGGKTAWITHEL